MRKRVILAAIVAVCLLFAGVSLFAFVDGWFGPITVSMRASRGIFEGGVIAGPTDQQDFLAIIALTPAEEREGAKRCGTYGPAALSCHCDFPKSPISLRYSYPMPLKVEKSSFDAKTLMKRIRLSTDSTLGLAEKDLTKRWSQLLAVAMRTFNFMKQFSEFAMLAAASGGSAPSC